MSLNFLKTFTISVVLLLAFGVSSLISPAKASAGQPPIPAGCPGSNRAGPPAPAGNGRTVCDTIPSGCPGSSHRGRSRPQSQCPYATARQSAQQVAQSVQPGYNSPGCNTATCGHQCGGGSNSYTPSVDIGCKGIGNPIMDALFGIIRFLSLGVGLIVIGSIIVGGIQYTASRGEPQATALAINRIRASLFALIIYIFAYAALNYIIPGWVLK